MSLTVLILTSLALIALLFVADWMMPQIVIVDNVIRLLIAFFGIVGPVAVQFPGFSAGAYNLIASGVEAAVDGPASTVQAWTVFWVWVFALVGAAGVIWPGKNMGFRIARLAAFIPFSIALYQFAALESVMLWYINGPGEAIAQFFQGVWAEIVG